MRSAIAKCIALVAVAVAVSAGEAAAQEAEPQCPKANPSYTGPCGPTFVLPSWGDGAGWTDPSKYSTIELADVNGDGRDELLGRDDQGVEIWRFDTDLGQWRPQVDAKALPQVLHDFRTALPEEASQNWKLPRHYSTIQTGNVDGQPGAEVLGRFPDGIHVYKYTPPAGGNAIDGGTWSLLNQGSLGVFSDSWGWTDPSDYLTIQTADVVPEPPGTGPREELISRAYNGILVYQWDGSKWTALPTARAAGNDDEGQQPSYYTNIITGRLAKPGHDVIVTRNREGVQTVVRQNTFWVTSSPDTRVNAFTDTQGTAACPFTRQTADCFSGSPSYYETLQMADIDGDPDAELLGRATDGLRVHDWHGGCCDDWTTALPTLTALAGPASMDEAVYGTIQTANLDGKGGREVLALDSTGLQAWSYDSQGRAWTKLTPSTPLELEGETWEDASTFSTIQAGDVDGDGRDDVIARGPFGIRTWFYNRRGTGGWESYRPQGYPAFNAGEGNAFDALTTLAKGTGVLPQGASSVRDVWTGENAPSDTTLAQLQQGVLSLAKCSDPIPGNPPSYQSCALPAGATGFTAVEWTAVINEVLVEISAAQRAVDHFVQLDQMREALFITQNAQFPSIGQDLHMEALEGHHEELDTTEYIQGTFLIAGALAAFIPGVGEAIAAGLEIAGESMAMLGSATPSFTTTLDTDYDGLYRHFRDSVSELDKAQEVLSQELRSDYGLTMLVGQLRARGTWNPDIVGIKSAANRGFALWIYQNLMPAVYTRFQITDCVQYRAPSTWCTPPGGSARGVLGNPNGPDFTTFGPVPADNYSWNGKPCEFVMDRTEVSCTYQRLPSELNDKLFAPMSERCNYQPGNAATAWTFGCSLGLNEKTSVDPTLGRVNGWTFFTWTGNPVTTGYTETAAVRVSARSAVSLAGEIHVPSALDPERTRIRAARVLFEPGGMGELVRPHQAPAQASGAAARRSRPVRVIRRRGARLAFNLSVARARVHLPHRCQQLPTAVSSDLEPFTLHTRLRLSDGRRTRTLTLHRHWRCVRGRAGHVSHLRPVRLQPRPRARPGLGIALRAPATVRPGTSARYRIVVTNRRRSPRARNRSSLWHVHLHATTRHRRTIVAPPMRELRRQRSKTRQIRVPIPRSATGRFCVTATATADLARSAGTRACVSVASTNATGCSARSSACATPIARRRFGGRAR